VSRERFLISSESVTEGHPDKLADQISDGILDAILAEDPYGRVACETLVGVGAVLVAGEVCARCRPDVPGIVRGIVKDVGYTRAKYGFDGDTCSVQVALNGQSPDIAMGVGRAGEEDPDAVGAGDQGMMVGYACDETEELMPLPISLAHRLARRLAHVRRMKILPWLRPDGKSQVTVEYDRGVPVRVDTVVISCQHGPELCREEIAPEIAEKVIRPILPPELVREKPRILVNPTGRFVLGGPQADTGLTGRKIIVDTYGGFVPHGGGAFSGKDPTKVDRSAAYMARYAAKNVVAAGLAKSCLVQVAYAIGVARPVSLMADTFGTGTIPDGRIAELIREHFDFRPAAVIRDLELRKPQYRRLAAYGHMGRIDLLPLPAWERTDRAEALRTVAG
jgi:S-adenosylmethionine synthetase